jgi:hypothetical protein
MPTNRGAELPRGGSAPPRETVRGRCRALRRGYARKSNEPRVLVSRVGCRSRQEASCPRRSGGRQATEAARDSAQRWSAFDETGPTPAGEWVRGVTRERKRETRDYSLGRKVEIELMEGILGSTDAASNGEAVRRALASWDLSSDERQEQVSEGGTRRSRASTHDARKGVRDRDFG